MILLLLLLRDGGTRVIQADLMYDVYVPKAVIRSLMRVIWSHCIVI